MAATKAMSANVGTHINKGSYCRNRLNYTVNQEHEYVLTEFLRGKDIFSVLFTGFGKSLIYQLVPLVIKTMLPGTNVIFIVVLPLIAPMEDQIQEASKLGITVIQIRFTTLQTYNKDAASWYSPVTKGELSLPAPTH